MYDFSKPPCRRAHPEDYSGPAFAYIVPDRLVNDFIGMYLFPDDRRRVLDCVMVGRNYTWYVVSKEIPEAPVEPRPGWNPRTNGVL